MKSIVLILLAVAVVAIPIFSQAPTGDRPQFEVASIKVHPPPLTQIGISSRGGRFVATGFSVKMLVGRGYAVPESRIVGGPNWIDSERYDIEAKAPENVASSQLQPMIQTMLEHRFKLKAHKETRELPIYELVVTKGGLKMKPSEDQTPPLPLPPPPPDRGAGPRGDAGGFARGPAPGPRGGPAPDPFGGGPRPRGSSGITISNGQFSYEGSAVPLATFVTTLQGRVDRPVVNKTGLTGLFDIKIQWSPGAEAPPPPFGPNPNAPPPPPPVEGPSIFTAIQEQLGLRLEGGKGPLEVIVIDSVEKPADN